MLTDGMQSVAGTCSGAPRSGRLSRIQGSVAILELCQEQVFHAYRVATTESEWAQYVLTDESFERLGPTLQDIVAHAEVRDLTAKFRYKLVLQYRFSNGDWQDGGELLSASTAGAAGYTIGTPFNDRQKFGVRIRVVLRAALDSGGNAGERGTLSVSLALRFFAS